MTKGDRRANEQTYMCLHHQRAQVEAPLCCPPRTSPCSPVRTFTLSIRSRCSLLSVVPLREFREVQIKFSLDGSCVSVCFMALKRFQCPGCYVHIGVENQT